MARIGGDCPWTSTSRPPSEKDIAAKRAGMKADGLPFVSLSARYFQASSSIPQLGRYLAPRTPHLAHLTGRQRAEALVLCADGLGRGWMRLVEIWSQQNEQETAGVSKYGECMLLLLSL